MDIDTWMRGYEKAWASNDADDIGALFAADAEYRVEPWTEPWRGRDAIVREWIARADSPGDWTFTWHLAGADPSTDTVFVQGETRYAETGIVYSNLWVIRFAAEAGAGADGGRALAFTEWWMDQAKPS
ncbi:nuclear transport factor 2 family protein [Schumannella sp. 10F1B-5-1]|uniref:nuclear transport factor 2 family protein n=1 Tax=Schumannella sp. 10F1B-5-1 TaxID=2590780 RepID=UPI0011322F87|nr:nuclear transport factor 2 family protein [Schumannella sp. 10F1B-5-1]TPW73056.1 nuclear transport factor 2 family protein [Schumannella sp. 10F1B-5-1]